MISLTLARKPLTGTVAANALRHGVGAVDVESCRIGTTKRVPGSPRGPHRGHSMGAIEAMSGQRADVGRWPANLLFAHTPDCSSVGTREVKTGKRHGGGQRIGGVTAYSGHSAGLVRPDASYGVNGVETIPAWDCSPDCPVAALDEQSGDRPSTLARKGVGGPNPGTIPKPGMFRGISAGGWVYGDSGGASRFFKVFGAAPE